jgi:hypothetical protein
MLFQLTLHQPRRSPNPSGDIQRRGDLSEAFTCLSSVFVARALACFFFADRSLPRKTPRNLLFLGELATELRNLRLECVVKVDPLGEDVFQLLGVG